MLNEKQTLRNLHKEFPELNLDDLFKILDCIVIEDYQLPAPIHYDQGVRTVPLSNITYEQSISKPYFTASKASDYKCCKSKRD